MGLLNHYYDKFSGNGKGKNGKKKEEVNPIHTEKVLDPLKGKLLEDEKFRTAFIVVLVFVVLWGVIDSLKKYSTPLTETSSNSNTSSSSSFDTSEIMQAFQEDLAKNQELTKKEKSYLYNKRREELLIFNDEIILPSGKIMIVNVPEGYQIDLTSTKVNEATYVGNRIGKDCQITIKALERVNEYDLIRGVFTKYNVQADISGSSELFTVSNVEEIEINEKKCYEYDVSDSREGMLEEKAYLAYYFPEEADGMLYIEVSGRQYLEDGEFEKLLDYALEEYNEEEIKAQLKILKVIDDIPAYKYSRSSYPGFSNYQFATYTGKILEFKNGNLFRIYSNTDINSLSLDSVDNEKVLIVFKNIIIKEKEDINRMLNSEESTLVTEIKKEVDDPTYKYSQSVKVEVGSITYEGFRITNLAENETRYILYGYLGTPEDGCIKADIKSLTVLKDEELKNALALELTGKTIGLYE